MKPKTFENGSFAFICLGIFLFACNQKETPSVKAVESPITYSVAREWAIPNGGFGKEIIIDPKYRSDSALRALGEQLKYETRSVRNAFILIFDHPKAAILHRDISSEKMSKADEKFHDDHMLGDYTRNGTTGHHQFQFGVNGFMNDPVIMVKY